MEIETIYLVISDPPRGSENVEAIFRGAQAADEYKESTERYYAKMTDDPPRFRVDERVLR